MFRVYYTTRHREPESHQPQKVATVERAARAETLGARVDLTGNSAAEAR